MFADRQLRAADVFAFPNCRNELGELDLGFRPGALEGMILDDPLAGHLIAAGIEFQFPRMLAASADVSGPTHLCPPFWIRLTSSSASSARRCMTRCCLSEIISSLVSHFVASSRNRPR